MSQRNGMVLGVVLGMFLFSGDALAQSRGKNLLEERPCGPDSMPGSIRYLFPQGHGQTDFRPACRCHDRCYEDPTKTQQQCDEEFRQRMLDRCAANGNRCGCRLVARVMYLSVRLFGAESFARGQRKGAERAATIAHESPCCPQILYAP